MMQAGAGLSTQKDMSEAAQEATQTALSRAGIDRADLVLVFATADHGAGYSRLLRTVQTTTQTPNVVGCSAGGVLVSGKEVERAAGIAVLVVRADSFAAERFFLPQLRGRSQHSGQEVAARAWAGLGPENLLLVFPDTCNFNSGAFFEGLSQGLSAEGEPLVAAVGGGASEDGSVGETVQMCGDTVGNNALSGALLSGNFAYSVGISQACQPIGPVHTVTKAHRNLILELDGRPAFAVFAELLLPPLREDLRRAAGVVFAGLPVAEGQHIAAGEYVVRNLIGFDAEQGIVAIADAVREGQSMVFTLRSGDGSRADLKRVLEDQARTWAEARPAFGLYVNCVGRGKGLYGFADLDTSYIAQYIGDVPIVGFFSGCEIAPIQRVESLLQYTGVLVLVVERSAPLH